LLPDVPLQGLQERAVRLLPAPAVAPTLQDPKPSPRGALGGLAQQARLADAGLASQQQHRWAAPRQMAFQEG
jgi:hypothetical protein